VEVGASVGTGSGVSVDVGTGVMLWVSVGWLHAEIKITPAMIALTSIYNLFFIISSSTPVDTRQLWLILSIA
jgi:hypothetical protein